MIGFKEELYKENILEHYKHPQNKGALDPCDFTEKGVNPSCGDVLTLCVVVKDGKIENISFDGEGCAISIAGASMLTEFAKEKTVKKLQKMEESAMFDMLGVSISPGREKCALLAYGALQKIVKSN